jgi:hypothetical protein
VNIAAVIQVSPPSSSFSSLGSAARPSLTIDPLGTFATLIDGLVTKGESSLLAGLIQEAQTDLASSGLHASARPKDKDSKIEEAGVSTAKKNELKTKAGLAQTAEVIPPVLQAPILFRALTWGTDSQASETSGDEPSADAGVEAPPSASITLTTLTSSRTAASLPIENDAVPARVAFGLRLTPLNMETSQVSRSRSESQGSVGLEMKTNTATEASRLPAQVLAAGSATTTNPDHSRDDQSGPSGGNLRTEPSPAPLTNPAAISRFEDVSAAHAGRSSAGDPAPTEPLDPANDPVGAPTATQAKQPDSSRIEQNAPQESNTNRGPELESVPIPSTASLIQIAQLANCPILPDGSGNQRHTSKNSVPGTLASRQDATGDAVTGDAHAPKEVNVPKAQPQRLGLESGNKESSPIPLRREVDVESNPDPRAARTGSERAVQPVAAPSELDTTKEGSTADAAEIQSQAADSQMATPRTTPSRPITPETTTTSQTTRSQSTPSMTTPVQTAALQATASQTTPSGGASHGAASSKTTPAPASANPAITNQAMTNQTSLSQATAFQTASQSTASQHSGSQSTQGANEIEVSPGPQPQPARQISLKLTSEDATKVSVDVSERGGKVQIAVRSADPELAKTLRSDLGDLVGRLESKGFKTEAWVPTAARHTSAAAPEQSDSHNSPGNPRDTGTNQRQGRQGQNGPNQRQQARWMAQLEDTIAIEETRTENK